MIACGECGSENESTATTCAACGGALDSAAVRALVGSLVLGVYKITDVLGQGGMSVVYKASHRMTDQVVALKILPPELAVHTDLKARFVEEAKALAKLEHPNIVRLYHFGEEKGRFVLAMQFVEGITFEQKIFRTTHLPWREATQIASEVLRALAYAHGKGVIHRDIKPSNILVRKDGSAMVMDFGIAKMAEGSSRLTATGQTMGTVRYMSPEQVRGQVVDSRSDLYSLGCTLYEGLTGDTPFDGPTHFDIMMKHISDSAPSPRSRGSDGPEILDKAISRALAKDPTQRYQLASEFLADLETALATAPGAMTPARSEDSRPPAAPGRLAAGNGADAAARPSRTADDARSARTKVLPTPATGSTGLAGKLEPDEALLRPRKRTWVWLALAALVLLSAAAVLFVTRRTSSSEPTSGQSPDPRPAETFPAPFLSAGLTPAADQTFQAPEMVRILSSHDLDPKRFARLYVQARERFRAYVSRQGLSMDVHPLNIVIASPKLMCGADLYQPKPIPADCEHLRFQYVPSAATLYVLENDNLETNLIEGASAHLCRTTPALLERTCMQGFLPPYWDEIERTQKK